MTAHSKKNWPSVYKNDWHIATINKKDIKQTAAISIPSGLFVQGGVVTEDYYVFGVIKNNNSTNNVYLVSRSSGKVVDKYSGNWGHMNSFYYKWGTKHVRVRAGSKSKDGCFDVSSGKLKKVSTSNCKTKRAPDYGTKQLVTQGNSASGEYVYVAGWDAHCYKYGYRQSYSYARHATGIFIYEKSSKKLKKTLYVPNSVVYSEIEDVSIDGNGDMHLLYNRDHKKAVFYKIDKAAIGLNTGGNNNNSNNNNSSGNSNSNSNSGNNSNSSNSNSNSASSDTNNDEAGNVKIEPEHDPQCATILSFWCDSADTDGETTILNIISFVIGVMTIGVTVLGTIGIIAAGVTIMSARDNAAQVQKAKQRILEIVIGLVIWVLIAAIMALLIPGGDSTTQEVLVGTTPEKVEVD